MTVEINIEWLSDYTDCETCGGYCAEGALVTIGDKVLDLEPYASCCNSVTYSEGKVYETILESLGFVVNHKNSCIGDY